jgi:hypothetical protein
MHLLGAADCVVTSCVFVSIYLTKHNIYILLSIAASLWVKMSPKAFGLLLSSFVPTFRSDPTWVQTRVIEILVPTRVGALPVGAIGNFTLTLV